MTKRAVILHGTDGSPDSNWFPWLKSKLEIEGYKVWVPLLPANHTPSRQAYNDFLLGRDWDFADNIVVGHSSGAVSILNLLMDERCPKIKMGVMVSAWKSGVPNGMDQSQFVNLFPTDGFDFTTIRDRAGALAFVHGDNDPYCPLEQAEYLASQLDSPLTIIPDGGHVGDKFTELPEVWQIIEPHL